MVQPITWFIMQWETKGSRANDNTQLMATRLRTILSMWETGNLGLLCNERYCILISSLIWYSGNCPAASSVGSNSLFKVCWCCHDNPQGNLVPHVRHEPCLRQGSHQPCYVLWSHGWWPAHWSLRRHVRRMVCECVWFLCSFLYSCLLCSQNIVYICLMMILQQNK